MKSSLTGIAPGLPEQLPEHERVIWQGSPDWRALALRAFHLRKIIIYSLALVVWRIVANYSDGTPVLDAVATGLWLALLLTAAIVGLIGIAWLTARSTIYTITNRRVVMRFGIALPMSVNLPFSRIDTAATKVRPDGTGNIALQLTPQDRVSYAVLWPHVRPWQITKPEPTFRAIPNADQVARILANALSEALPPHQMNAAQPAGQEPVEEFRGRLAKAV